jgi:hypothetical protein
MKYAFKVVAFFHCGCVTVCLQDAPTKAAAGRKSQQHQPGPPTSATPAPSTLGKVVLPSQLLMEALNEHVGDGSIADPAAWQPAFTQL